MSNLYSRRSILKKTPVGLGLAAGAGTGLLTFDSARTPASASNGITNLQESDTFYSDTWDQRCSFKTWDYQADSSTQPLRYAQVINQYGAVVAQDSMKLWRLQDETLGGLDGMVLESYDGDNNLRYRDDGLILSDLNHAEEHRRLLDEPEWGDESMVVDEVSYFAQASRVALSQRLHWREFTRFTDASDVGGLEIHLHLDSGSVRTYRINRTASNFSEIRASLAVIRTAWQVVYAGAWAAGGAGVTGGATFASGAYLAGAATVKGGAALGAATASGALLTVGVCFLALALAAAAILAVSAAIAFDQYRYLRFYLGADDDQEES